MSGLTGGPISEIVAVTAVLPVSLSHLNHDDNVS